MGTIEEAYQECLAILTKEAIFAEAGPKSQWVTLPTNPMKAAVLAFGHAVLEEATDGAALQVAPESNMGAKLEIQRLELAARIDALGAEEPQEAAKEEA